MSLANLPQYGHSKSEMISATTGAVLLPILGAVEISIGAVGSGMSLDGLDGAGAGLRNIVHITAAHASIRAVDARISNALLSRPPWGKRECVIGRCLKNQSEGEPG